MSLLIPAIIAPTVILASALVPKDIFGKKDDKKNIEKIFVNMNLGIPPKHEDREYIYPKFKKKVEIKDGEKVIGYNYRYLIPLGFPATKLTESDLVAECLSDGLMKPVRIVYDYLFPGADVKFLQIKVFNEDIPKLVQYKDIPNKKGWVIPLGKSVERFMFHNFEHIPHMVVAGTTRFGKTVFLKGLVTYLTEHHEDDVAFHIIDLKGGLEFTKLENLKQVKSVSANSYETFETLRIIQEMLYKRMSYFREKGYSNITDTPIKERIFVVVDEAAQLAPDRFHTKEERAILNECLFMLSEISRIGGGLGFRLIFCTQYPTADTLPRQIKMTSDAKFTFRLSTGYASQVAIDEYGAEKLPSDLRGRGLYKTHETKEIQVPLLEDKEMLDRLDKYMIFKEDKPGSKKGGEVYESARTEGETFIQFG